MKAERRFGGVTISTESRAGYFLGTSRWRDGEFFRSSITDACFL
jgi:hypothetical protein